MKFEEKNKFKLISMIVFMFMFLGIVGGCSKKADKTLEDNKSVTITKIRLNEVICLIFYEPMYAAINEGFFKEEGIDIELTTGQGADATISKPQVLRSNRCT